MVISTDNFAKSFATEKTCHQANNTGTDKTQANFNNAFYIYTFTPASGTCGHGKII